MTAARMRLGGAIHTKGLGSAVGLCDEAVDGDLKFSDGSERATFEAPVGELGEEAFDGIKP